MNDVKYPELLPCPFCGDDAAEEAESAVPSVEGGHKRAVYCNNCFAEGPTAHTTADAITAWNARADATGALRGAQKESGWQSIDSAPKDGTHILLYREHIRFVGFYAPNGKCWVHNAPGLPLINPEPTHWSPLREMPTPIPGEAK